MSALRRLRPDGLGPRLAMLLAAALLAANLIALALLWVDGAQRDRAVLVEREAERVVSLLPAIEAAAPAARGAIAREASTRFSRVSVDAGPTVRERVTGPRAAALARALADTLDGRTVRAAIRLQPERTGRPRPQAVALSIALTVPDGAGAQWLNVVSRGDRRGPPGLGSGLVLLVLGLSMIFVLGVALVTVRRLTRPLRELACAARASGRGDRAVRVVEHGPREMRDAAAAFNDMQGRIARFEAERMRMVAAVGHDLRTPITSLRIRAELLDEAEAAPMIRTLDEMAVMADGLVAYARDARDAEAAGPVALADMLARLCDARGATFEASDSVTVAGRPVALGRALGNLIDNAIRHGGTARVGLRRDAGFAVIVVDDDGPGIAPDRLAAVFDPFVRGDDSRSTDTGGAGLGLSIARTIVAAHGGTVSLENRAGQGLRAVVRLPCTGRL